MKPSHSKRSQGFTLLETVIAIGVLSVLLTGFIVVFTPAAQGIRKSINVQDADRLASALEQELVTHRAGDNYATGFDKAFNWIRTSDKAASAVLVYQYRGELGGTTRPDGTIKLVNPPASAADAYPLSSYTYVIVPETSPKASVLKPFLDYAVGSTGQAFGPPAYPALPSAVASSAKALIAKIHS